MHTTPARKQSFSMTHTHFGENIIIHTELSGTVFVLRVCATFGEGSILRLWRLAKVAATGDELAEGLPRDEALDSAGLAIERPPRRALSSTKFGSTIGVRSSSGFPFSDEMRLQTKKET